MDSSSLGRSLVESHLCRNKSHTICVRGLDVGTVDDTIFYFFSNMKRSHGGPVNKVERSPNKKAALVHFKDFKDAENVVEKGDHILDGNRLQVTLHKRSDKQDDHVTQQHFAEEPASRRIRPATRRHNTLGNSTCSASTSTESKETRSRLSTRLTGQKTTFGEEQEEPKDATQLSLSASRQVHGSFGWSSQSGQYSETWDRMPEAGGSNVASGLYSDGAKHEPRRNIQYGQAENESTMIEDRVRGRHGQTQQDSQGGSGKGPALKSARSVAKQGHHDETDTPERKIKVMIPAAIVQRITGDCSLLRNLTMTLKKADGRFRWKQPNHIIITCLTYKPSDDWENLVAEQVQKFIQPLMQNEQPVVTEETGQVEPSTTTLKAPTSSARSCAAKGAYSTAKQDDFGTAQFSPSKKKSVSPDIKQRIIEDHSTITKTPTGSARSCAGKGAYSPVKQDGFSIAQHSPSKLQVKMLVSPDSKQRIIEDRSTLRGLTMALASVHGKFCWQPKHITVNCTVDHPPPDWERLVTEQVNKFIGPAT